MCEVGQCNLLKPDTPYCQQNSTVHPDVLVKTALDFFGEISYCSVGNAPSMWLRRKRGRGLTGAKLAIQPDSGITKLYCRKVRIMRSILLCFMITLFTAPVAFSQNEIMKTMMEEYKKNNPRVARKMQNKHVPQQTPIAQYPQPPENRNRVENTIVVPDPFESQFGNTSTQMEQETINQVGYQTDLNDNRQKPNRFLFHEEMKSDARLYDVYFRDSTKGWAVGDHGAIWNTSDGGRNWVLQPSPVDCPLKSVSFADEVNGIIVGGFTEPYVHNSKAIVLRTTDGGASWTQIPTQSLPALSKVEYLDHSTVRAVGISSEASPSGMFQSVDGGRTWETVPGKKNDGWKDVRFLGTQFEIGAGIGNDGSIQLIRSGTPRLSKNPPLGMRKPLAIELFSNQQGFINGWLVGQGGLILCTNNTGESWQNSPGNLPGVASDMFDFNTVFARGNDIWIAGSPGSRIFHSHDGGRTWNSSPTGVNVAIQSIRFVDPVNGFAVGELGTILTTNDSGATWMVQRSGGTRVALLGIFENGNEIPLEMFVKLSAEDCFLSAVEIPLQSGDFEQISDEIPRINRIHEAVVSCGVSSASQSWGFRLDRSELKMSVDKLVEKLEKENDGVGLRRFRRDFVLSIRKWKPNIIVAPAPDANVAKRNAARDFLVMELNEAVRAAADPTIFPEQITEASLEPWNVDKIFLVSEDGTTSDVRMKANGLAIRIGVPIDEISELARGLIRSERSFRPISLGFQTVFNKYANASHGKNDLMSGISLPPNSGARRTPLGSADNQLDEIQRRASKRNQVLGIMEKFSAENKARNSYANPDELQTNAGVQLASNSRELVRDLDPTAAISVLLDLGLRFRENGDLVSAEETYSIITEMYPQHPLSADAFRWLIQFYASEESVWRILKQNKLLIDGEIGSSTTTVSKFDSKTGKMVSQEVREGATTNNLASEHKAMNFRRDRITDFYKFLAVSRPDIARNPEIRFPFTASQRKLGYTADAGKYYLGRSLQPNDDLWAARARGEQWLMIPNKQQLPPNEQKCPLPFLVARYAQHKPYLDGKFDEIEDRGFWFASPIASFTQPPQPNIRLASATGPSIPKPDLTPNQLLAEKNLAASVPLGTQAMMMYDKNCLYIALRCRQSNEFQYAEIDDEPRPRDPDLSEQDRIEILIDIDRDYTTYYKIEIDNRGWVAEESWGDKSWNPTLYVARDEENGYWMIEAAIPLDSLTGKLPRSGDVWGIALRRIVPEVGIECWNAENSKNLSEAFGFLVFE